MRRAGISGISGLAGLAGMSVLAGLHAFPALADLSDRHELEIRLNWNLVETDSSLGAWTDGGHGKLRYDTEGSVSRESRLALEYTGRLAPQLFAHAALDYNDTAGETLGLTEAYLQWRPLPTGPNRHRFRFGAFYPAFSFENSDFAWESPYSRSFSGINAWIGEEIRPIGMEWRLSRRLGSAGAAHEIGAFASAFIGNDTAATLLFWRGWSLHDRQTRLNERLPLPTIVMAGSGGDPDIVVERRLDPIAEIDDAPGFYLGSEWRYAQRARLSLAYWDNMADPEAIRNNQFAWNTRFWHLAAQLELPGAFGVIAQYMRGDTDWLINLSPTGQPTSRTTLGTDEFESAFLLLSKRLSERQRLSLRLDDFHLWRDGALEVDRGDAITIAYDFAVNSKLRLRAEWLEIESRRDLWPIFYDSPARADPERQLLLGFDVVLFDSTG